MLIPNAVCAAKGKTAWRPSRDLSQDWSAWGNWEAWMHHHVVDGNVEPTGSWCVWNSETGENLAINHVFFGGPKGSRRIAETLAVLRNEGLPTRLVTPCLSVASCMSFAEVHAKWGHLEAEFYGGGNDSSAGTASPSH